MTDAQRACDDAQVAMILRAIIHDGLQITYGALRAATGIDRYSLYWSLDRLNRVAVAAGQPMPTVVVVSDGTDTPGPGFCKLARKLGRFTGEDTAAACQAFVARERQAVVAR